MWFQPTNLNGFFINFNFPYKIFFNIRHTRKVITDFVSSRENSIYIMNLCHMVSILSDSLIYCCGGLLPLLASATSKNFTNDVLEPCGGMTLDAGFSFLNRILNIVDIIAFATSMNFSSVEQHRNMSGGGVLRQCIRLGELILLYTESLWK